MDKGPTALTEEEKAAIRKSRITPSLLKFTNQKQLRFLATLAATGNISRSAKEAGISRRLVYEYRDKFPKFDLAWQEALETYRDNLEEAARIRAVEGFEKNIYYQGEVVGQETFYSDRLLELLLEGTGLKSIRCENPQAKTINLLRLK